MIILPRFAKEWEAEANRLSEKVRTVIFRFGVVLGKGGALHKNASVVPFGHGRSNR